MRRSNTSTTLRMTLSCVALATLLVQVPGVGLSYGPVAVAATAGSLTWTTPTTLPANRARPAVAAGADGIIYVFGGTNGSDTDYNTTFIYHPISNTWSTGAVMPTAREGAQAVTLPDGRIAVLGGGSGCWFTSLCSGAQSTVYNTVEVYSPISDTWTSVAPLQTPRYRFAAALYNGKIYAIGGASGAGVLASVEAYDPASNSWSYVPSLPQAEEAPAAAVTPGGALVVVGGYDGSATYYGSTLSYTGGSGWALGAALPTARSDLALTTGVDGQLYAIGGYINGVIAGSNTWVSSGWLATVEAYDPTTNSWTSVAPLPTARCCLGAVTLPSGPIYALGGDPSVAMLAPAAGGPPATATPAASPTVSPTSTAGATLVGAGSGSGSPAITVQQTVRVTGTNYLAGEPVSVYWDTSSAPPVANATSGPAGSFAVKVTVPQAISGTHSLIAVGQAAAVGISSRRFAAAPLQVKPKVVLLHASGIAGSRNVLYGIGFPAKETVIGIWSPKGGPVLGGTTTNALGTFAGAQALTFTVPLSLTSSYQVYGVGLHSRIAASTWFTVTAH